MRTRNVELIIYDKKILDKKIELLEVNPIEYAYILHDRDLDESTNQLKKAHYHLLIMGEYQRTISAWATFLNVKENEVQVIENKRRSIRYLIHFDSKDKYKYNYNDIVSNMLDLDIYFNQDKLEESTQLGYIFDYIDSIIGYIYFKEVKSYVLSNNYWGAYRRYYSIIKDVILEHNRYCIDYMLN